MWAELFIENKEALLFELDCLQTSLQKYRDALAAEDFGALRALLDEAKDALEDDAEASANVTVNLV